MASEVTITPGAGNAPFPTQGGTGAAPGFDALDFRRFWSRAYREGVVSATGWRVTEAATPGLTVEVAANQDPALVQGDAVTDQGCYYVAPHSGVAVLDVATPDATNPRVDRVVLRVLDDAHDGSGSTTAKLEILAGTPTSGATLDNLSGAVALPDTALLLANVLVGANASQVTNSEVRDMRRFGLRDANVGDLALSAAATAAAGWVPCDGRLLRRDQYADLFAAIGTAWGAGDGSTTFAAPDLRDRVPVGAGQNAAHNAVGDTDGLNIGARGVEHTHDDGTLAADSHDHDAGGLVQAFHSHTLNDGLTSDLVGQPAENQDAQWVAAGGDFPVPGLGHKHAVNTTMDSQSPDISGNTAFDGAGVSGVTGSDGPAFAAVGVHVFAGSVAVG